MRPEIKQNKRDFKTNGQKNVEFDQKYIDGFERAITSTDEADVRKW